ncbi:MAG: complex I subunit 4 family protein [Thermoplasmatota archaeon]
MGLVETALPALTLLLLAPLAGALVTLLMPGRRAGGARWVALLFSLLPLLMSIYLYALVWSSPAPAESPGYLSKESLHFKERVEWVPALGVTYSLGVDGISLPLVLLTSLLTFVAVLFSFTETHRPREYFGLMLVMEVGVLGVFMALDFFLFYIFWEVVLIPMYFLIGIWGGPRREYAAIKFFIYTHVASVVMLLGIMGLYFQCREALGRATFDIAELASVSPALSPGFQYVAFAALFFGFMVKMPSVPFHTWLPDAHVEAPTAGSVLLAGLLLKMGGYGLLRVALPLLPAAAEAAVPVMVLLGAASIIYGALVCIAQNDLKKMVAFSSISHMGFVMLGASTLSPIGISAGVFQMFNHGLVTAVLFMMCGVFHHSTGTREISRLGGLARRIPVAAAVFLTGSLASLGLPGLCSFVSEFLVFYSAFVAHGAWMWLPVTAVVLTAGYYLWAAQRVLFGGLRVELPREEMGRLEDLQPHEAAALGVLVALIVLFGLFPSAVLDLTNPVSAAVAALLRGVG